MVFAPILKNPRLEIQEEMIKELMSEAKKANVHNLQGIVGDAQTILFEPESFDLIYIALTLSEIPDRQSVLRSCYEALKPSGVLSVTEFFLDPHFTSKRQVKRLAEAAGFKQKETFGQWWSFTSNFKKVERLQTSGQALEPTDLAKISPRAYKHLISSGTYLFSQGILEQTDAYEGIVGFG